jgi:protein arginine kinase
VVGHLARVVGHEAVLALDLSIEDKVSRACATLKYARVLSSQECMGLVSAVRFGVTIGMRPLPALGILNDILLYSQAAHLQKMAGSEMSSAERNEYRATWIQKHLNVDDAPRSAVGP